MTRKKGYMTFELFAKILVQVEGMTLVLHHSGESFLHKELFDMIRYAKAKGFTVRLTTNGTMLDRDNYDIFRTGLDVLNISLYDNADKITLAYIQRDLMKSNTKITVNSLNLKKLKTVLADEKIYRPTISWSGRVDVKTRRRLKVYLRALLGKPLCQMSPGILWDGTVVPCCFDFNGDLALGNINRDSFERIWARRYKLQEIHKSFKKTKAHPICGPCRLEGK